MGLPPVCSREEPSRKASDCNNSRGNTYKEALAALFCRSRGLIRDRSRSLVEHRGRNLALGLAGVEVSPAGKAAGQYVLGELFKLVGLDTVPGLFSQT